MEPLGSLIQKAQANLQRKRGPGGEPPSRHGCYGGWIYEGRDDGHDVAKPCSDCQAEREVARVSEELKRTGVGERYWGTMWDSLDMVEPLPELRAAADRIGTILDAGDHLLLSGPPGSGKTQAAVLLMRAALAAHRTARLVNIGRAAMEVRAAYNQDSGPTEEQVVRRTAKPDLLVLDDLGAAETGNAAVESRVLYQVLEQRQNQCRSTLITTNLTPKELKDRLGQRLIGRLQPLTIKQFHHGRNFRKPTGKTSWEAGS